MHTGKQTSACVLVAYGTDHPRSMLSMRSLNSYYIYIDTERPPDSVSGAVRRSYTGLAEYPVALVYNQLRDNNAWLQKITAFYIHRYIIRYQYFVENGRFG